MQQITVHYCQYLYILCRSGTDIDSREYKAEASFVESDYCDLFVFLKSIEKSKIQTSLFLFSIHRSVWSPTPPIPFLGAISIWGFRPLPHKQTLSLLVEMQICYLTGLCFLSRGRFPFFRCGEYAMKIWCDLMNNEYVLEYGDKVR